MTEPDTTTTDAPADSFAFSRAALVALFFILLLYVAARLWRLDATCLWFDELFSVHAARHSWGEMLRFVAADLIHPPLFYALLKIWIAIGGESLAWLRLFPALTAITAIAPFLLLARELRLRAPETNVALLLLAANGYLIKYAQEVRMYSLLLLLALTSLWLFAKLLRAETSAKGALLCALFAVNLPLIYTHYYGWLVVVAEAIFLALRARGKLASFLLMVAALAACFAPWVYVCLAAAGEAGGGLAQNIGWQARPRAGEVWQLFALFQQPFYFRQSSAEPPYVRWGAPLGFALMAAPALLLLLRAWKKKRASEDKREREDEQREAPRLLFFFALAPVAFAFILSYALPQSIWGARHLIIAAAPYLLLAALALTRLRPVWLRVAAFVILGGWLAFAALANGLRREEALIWCAWEGLAAQARQAEVSETPVNLYAFEDLVAYHLWHALDAGRDARFHVMVVKRVPGLKEDPAYFLPRRFDGVTVTDASAITADRLWLAFRDASLSEERPPLNLLRARGYHIERIFETGAQGQRAFLVLAAR
jgi:uncharacterized membrane protein